MSYSGGMLPHEKVQNSLDKINGSLDYIIEILEKLTDGKAVISVESGVSDVRVVDTVNRSRVA